MGLDLVTQLPEDSKMTQDPCAPNCRTLARAEPVPTGHALSAIRARGALVTQTEGSVSATVRPYGGRRGRLVSNISVGKEERKVIQNGEP